MSDQPASSAAEQKSAPQDVPQPGRTHDEVPTSTPVEMTDLEDKKSAPADRPTSASSSHRAGPTRTDTATAIDQATHPPPPPPATIPETAPAQMSRTFSTAIGPSSDSPVVPAKDTEETGPNLLITLLLTSGARHPFRLNAKYLAKRNVEVPGGDPFNLSVYGLKELILREWREEWEAKPASPSSIRLISFGKLLDDKAPLKDSRLNADSPNVLHMTIKPQDFVEDEDAKGGKSSMSAARDEQGRSPGCRCNVM
ncbi:uncharacterized protein HMPREF1541_03843 [Cyphellophora europaea CBS 101466]|uniref:UBL3-like ubiquitin domain-containing protein n=1 Tax=Cyphellophora europaea (strain CBS 101466) TaxID=1220924 RepID=W2S1T6_CYPE1|nr:uncharacterized protein HMPREF1541_03843 [Cyphellophora europaea CBS 101466]ETN41904.1 hypothetical protein HMPREF1541_03843 [Cyphellophora europaea CBS 101466]